MPGRIWFMQFVDLGGVAVHYDIDWAGENRPVVALVNSLGTDSRIWHHVIPKLAGDYTVLTYDKRGHGLSDLGNPP